MERSRSIRLAYQANRMENAPKDRRILAWGKHAWENEPGWATVKWCDTYSVWNVDPNEATEYNPEACELTRWMDLPTEVE
jgi:hypothetical protein